MVKIHIFRDLELINWKSIYSRKTRTLRKMGLCGLLTTQIVVKSLTSRNCLTCTSTLKAISR